MNILIRCDASVHIGTGHVMRCLTLAEELKAQGSSVEFLCTDLPGDLIKFIGDKGFAVFSLKESPDKDLQVTEFLSGKPKYDWIILDNYGYSYENETPVREFTHRLMVIDDLANRRHDCDILLDQNYSRETKRYDSLVPATCVKLLGPEYALLRNEFAEIRKNVEVRSGSIHKILIFFGGADEDNVTLKAISALKDIPLSGLAVDVVIGLSNPNRSSIERAISETPGATLSVQVSDMAKRMASADLFIGAGGATTWERMSLGLPSIVIIIADNQQKIAEDLARDELIINLGWHEDVTPDIINSSVLSLVNNPEKLNAMSQRIMGLVDGFGAHRVAQKLVAGADLMPTFSIRRADIADMENIFALSNDPDVRKVSIHKNGIKWEDHIKWYCEKISSENVLFLVAYSESVPFAAQIRFDIHPSHKLATISISLHKGIRGKGFASEILAVACREFKERFPDTKIKAYINPDNISSTKLFLKSGFFLTGEEEVNKATYNVYIQ